MPAAMASKNGEPLSELTESLLEQGNTYSAGGFGPLPGFIASARGSTLTVRCYYAINFTLSMLMVLQDVDGKEILDFAVTMGTVNLGHCNPEVTKAVIDSLQKGRSSLKHEKSSH